jgi:uncharacterized protein
MKDDVVGVGGTPSTRLDRPMPPAERYAIIDIVRGFALFGVMLSNMVLTTQFLALPGAAREAMPTARLDTLVIFLIDTLITDKFYTLFSMLFGLGFAVQLHRATARNVDVLPTYMRRLVILFVFGVLHGSLLWFGDVLHIYALLGFILVLLSKRSDRFVVACIVGIAALAGMVPVLDWVARTRAWAYPLIWGEPVTPSAMFEVLSGGSYVDILRLNWEVHLQDYGQPGFSDWIGLWYLDILWRFLLGFLIGRHMLTRGTQEYRSLFTRLLRWALPIGLLGNAVMSARLDYRAWSVESGFVNALLSGLDEVWVLALAVSYVCILALVYQRPRLRRPVGWLAPVGRMALTNYVTQSAFMMLLFYGIGLGWIGTAGAAACLGASLAIFAIQTLWSFWWLAHFRFGPLEWLWRSLTYGRLQPLRAH